MDTIDELDGIPLRLCVRGLPCVQAQNASPSVRPGPRLRSSRSWRASLLIPHYAPWIPTEMVAKREAKVELSAVVTETEEGTGVIESANGIVDANDGVEESGSTNT